MWFHSTEAQMQTNSSAEGLIYRHLPSSLPSTPRVGKTFIDLYYSGDSWNPKKWMVEVSGRPTVLAVTLQAAILLSHSYGGVAASLPKSMGRSCTRHRTLQTHQSTSHTSPPFQAKTAKPLWVLRKSYTISFTDKESNVWRWQEQR